MHTFMVHTLVDITDNGNLKNAFPFKTKAGELIHDVRSLNLARSQNSNFTTMLQLLQIRGNITWEFPPKKISDNIINMKFGSVYDGKQSTWHFTFYTEQDEVYGNPATNNVGQLIEDFDLVPILSFAKETVSFPSNAFITENERTLNTYFSYAGIKNK